MVNKRPAAAQVNVPKKQGRISSGGRRTSTGRRGRPDDGTASKCAMVTAALEEASSLQPTVRKMLAGAATPALQDFKDSRHSFQEQVITWIGEALAAEETALSQSAATAQTTADAQHAEKTTREAAVTSAEENLVALKQAVVDAEEANTNAVAARSTAEQNLKKTEEAASAVETDEAAAVQKKADLQAIMAEDGIYVKMKTETPSKTATGNFTRTMKKHCLDAALLQTLGPVLMKEASVRSEFDNMVFGQFEEAMQKNIADAEATIGAAPTAKETKKAEIEAAKKALEDARAQIDTKSNALKEAQTAVKQGDATVKEAKKAVKDHAGAIKEVEQATKSALGAAMAFRKGPLAAFQELKERCAPPEEPEEPEQPEEPAPQEPAEATAQESETPAAPKTED